jgi:hypothetical protein
VRHEIKNSRPCLKTRRIRPAEKKEVKEEKNNGRDKICVQHGVEKKTKQKKKKEMQKNFFY